MRATKKIRALGTQVCQGIDEVDKFKDFVAADNAKPLAERRLLAGESWSCEDGTPKVFDGTKRKVPSLNITAILPKNSNRLTAWISL